MGAVLAVALLIFAIPSIFARPIADINAPEQQSIGYVDFKVSVGLYEECSEGTIVACWAAARGASLSTVEKLELPTSPASMFSWSDPATLVGTCAGRVVLTITGPGISYPITTQSVVRNIAPGETETYPFGHLYLTTQGTYSVDVAFQVKEVNACNGSQDYLTILQAARSFEFDGINEGGAD